MHIGQWRRKMFCDRGADCYSARRAETFWDLFFNHNEKQLS